MAQTFDLEAATEKANNGDAVSQLVVGDYYSKHPERNERDYDLAMRWYQNSFESGYSLAAYRIGKLYEEGKGCTSNETKALEWYERGSEASCVACSMKLMFVYSRGHLGVEADQALAEHYESRFQKQTKENGSRT
jgi:hypothetical protein